MGNLILQHWNGPLPEWARLATATIEKYAKSCGADYHLETGYPMGKERGVLAQKLIFLDKKFDSYNEVLLLDTDMVATHIYDNVFHNVGVGRLHRKGMEKLEGSRNGRKWPHFWEHNYPMFFGNFVKLGVQERMRIREHLPPVEDFVKYKDQGEEPNDEIILSYMMRKAGLNMPHEVDHPRFCDLPEEAHRDATLIHFCGGRKRNIIGWMRENRKDIL